MSLFSCGAGRGRARRFDGRDARVRARGRQVSGSHQGGGVIGGGGWGIGQPLTLQQGDWGKRECSCGGGESDGEGRAELPAQSDGRELGCARREHAKRGQGAGRGGGGGAPSSARPGS